MKSNKTVIVVTVMMYMSGSCVLWPLAVVFVFLCAYIRACVHVRFGLGSSCERDERLGVCTMSQSQAIKGMKSHACFHNILAMKKK